MELPQPPPDQELKNIIDKLAQFVARNGPEFEQMTKTKQKDNPKFSFLFGGEYFNYYQYKVTTEQAILKHRHAREQQQQQQQPQPSPQPALHQPPPGPPQGFPGGGGGSGFPGQNFPPAYAYPPTSGYPEPDLPPQFPQAPVTSGGFNQGQFAPPPPSSEPPATFPPGDPTLATPTSFVPTSSAEPPFVHSSQSFPPPPPGDATYTAPQAGEPGAFTTTTPGFAQPPPHPPPSVTIESLVNQQQQLQEQIHQSEQNLAAQQLVLDQQKEGQVREGIYVARGEVLRNEASELGLSTHELDELLGPITESCTKDSISNGKHWIFTNAQSPAKNQWLAHYLLWKATANTGPFNHKLHIIYLMNDVLHHCVRKNADDLKEALEKVLVPMFCSAMTVASDDQKSKLDKLLSLWESKINLEDVVLMQLKNPVESWGAFEKGLIEEFPQVVATINQHIDATFEGYKQQHNAFVQHATNQIQALEQEYVSQNMKEEEEISAPPAPPPPPLELPVKVEALSTAEFEEEEEVLEEEDDPMEDDGDSGEEDLEGGGGLCSGDGKKSLPHKKRIPRKLKATRRHNLKSHKCAQCGQQFLTQPQLAAHRLTHTPPPTRPKPFRCEICGRGLETQLKFFEHLKGHYEPNKKHRCEVCGGEFASAEALQEHALVHSREHFKCELCNKTFRKESMLEVHLKVAHVEEEEAGGATEKPYSCLACPKSYRTQIALDSHVQTDHGENPPEFNCEDCYRVFKSKAKLMAHRKAEHKEEVPQPKGAPKKKVKVGKSVKGGYACNMCTRVFTHKNSLVYHIRGHTGERPHQCDQCGKSFYAASALKVHLRLHSGEKPYKCQMCEKYFRQWGDLRYHTTSVHSEKRQYQCEFCGKDFKRKYCLVVHRRIHTGEKNYKCEYCGKAFRAASYLQNHKRIHTGERPHPCPDCGKPFRVRSDMKRHRQTHMRDGTSTSVTPAPQPHVTQVATPQSPSPTVTAQLVPGTITQATSQPQLILSDSVSVPVSGEQPIRIMVSGLNAQHVAAAMHPPPAHRQSQHVAVPVSGNIATLTAGPVSPGGTATLSPEVIIMDDNTHQPINLNIIPRMITPDQVASSPHGSHATLVTEEEVGEYQLANSGRNTLEVRGEEGNVYVWHGVFTN